MLFYAIEVNNFPKRAEPKNPDLYPYSEKYEVASGFYIL